MYESYWGLSASPFRAPCGRRFWHESPTHAEALARLLFLVEHRRSLGVVCGPAGCGKSQLLAVAAESLARSGRRVVAVDLTGLDAGELVAAVAEGLEPVRRPHPSAAAVWRTVADDLVAARLSELHTVLVFDGYEKSRPGCRQAIERLLCAAGPPEWLTAVVAVRPLSGGADWRDFDDACELRVEIERLGRHETAAYVTDLFRQAGGMQDAFADEALDAIHRLTGGIPRWINRLCDLALLAAVSEDARLVDAVCIERAAEEIGLHQVRRPAPRRVAG